MLSFTRWQQLHIVSLFAFVIYKLRTQKRLSQDNAFINPPPLFFKMCQ